MSRCFPFPPPGYIGFKASNHDALIESIKLQRECEKAKAERKKEESEKAKAERKKEKEEKKREKKEKRERKEKRKAEKEKKKEEKEKAKQYPYGAQDSKAHKIGAPDGEAQKSLADCKRFSKEKTIADMDEQMERSDLTEEHQQPVSVPKRSSSSDSTENSNKRKRSASPSRNGGISGQGNVLRIRLPLGKNKEPKVAKEPICSTSGRTESAAPLRKDPPVQGHRIEDKKQICSTSGANQVFTPVDVPKPSVLTAFEKEMQAASLLYNKLVGSLALPVIPATYSEALDLDDDQEWLFGRKKQVERQVEKRQKPNSDIPCRSSSLLQPCAQFLPDVGIYALPYTLPF